MIPNKVNEPIPNKYFLLEEGDIIKEGDEYYNPFTDQWLSVTNGDKDDANTYPDAMIGYEWNCDEYKPVRRLNKDYRV